MSNLTAEKMIHETFDTTEKDRTENWKLRQERFQTGDLKYVLKLEGKELEVINYSSFGIGVYCKEKLPDKKTFSNVPFLMESTEICQIEIKVVRVEAMADKGFKIGFEIVGTPLNLSRINGVTGAIELQNISNARLRHKDEVSPKVRSLVYEVKNELEVIEDDLVGVQESTVFINNQEKEVYEEAMVEGMARHMALLIQNALDAMQEAIKGMSKEETKHAYDFFRNNLRHLIFQSPFSSRSVEKPLGYAGDFEMMRMLYRDENLGNCLFGKALHRCLMDTSNARAVRNRADYLTNVLKQACERGAKRGKPIKILSVASGPAEEVRRILEMKNLDVSTIHIDLIDQDLAALRAAQFQIKEAEHRYAKHLSVKYIHKAIKNLVMEGLPGEYDMIYSAGLFDYFSDAVARLAGTKLFESLVPKGEMIIGNFTAAQDVKIRMELVLDWNLVYRTKEDLIKLYSKIARDVEVEQESEGINLFVRVRK